MSKNIYRAGELKYGRGNVLLGERPGTGSVRSRFLRDIEDEVSKLQRELSDLRGTYENEARSLAESYGKKKSSLEAELAEIRNTSESESKRIRDAAAAEVDKEKKRGYDEGNASGHKAGHAEAAQAIAAETKAMQEKIQEARDAFLNRILASESKLFETALTVAERIVRQKIQVDPDVVKEAVREAVAQIRESRPVRIRIHPTDVARLEEFKKMSPDAFRDLPATLLADETLSPGDCIAETGLEFIDATVGKKLETLRDRLIPRSVL